jgi:hypothetical protein
MHKHTPIPLPAEPLSNRLRNLLIEGYLASLVRGRWRWVGGTLAVSLAVTVGLTVWTAPYRARVLIEDERLCAHGYLKPTVIKSPSMGHQSCPHCKPTGSR